MLPFRREIFLVSRSDEGIAPDSRLTSRDKDDEGAKAENDDDNVPLSLKSDGWQVPESK